MNEESFRGVAKEPILVYQRRDDDCFRACVATILGISYDDIDEPDINLETDKWLHAWRLFLNSKGFDICFFNYAVMDEWMPKGYTIGIGKSPRGKDHAIICLDGKPFFDPFKNSTGYPEKFDSYGIITLINPFSAQKQAFSDGRKAENEAVGKLVNDILNNYKYESLEEKMDKARNWPAYIYLIQEEIAQAIKERMSK